MQALRLNQKPFLIDTFTLTTGTLMYQLCGRLEVDL